MPEIEELEIVVCLGSSCFARGNPENLAIVEEFIGKRGLKASIHLSGQLCQDQCKRGPNLTLAGVLHHEVTPSKLRELLQQLDKQIVRK